MHLHFRAFLRKLPVSAVVASGLFGLGIAIAAAPQALQVPTTLADFQQPGTQPLGLLHPVYSSNACQGCHSGYDPDQEPYERWSASMMAQSTRDPVFQAAMTIANQDASDSGELCLRCHAPGAWLSGRSTPADGSALDSSQGDFDGVTCHMCHRMVDPVFTSENPSIDARILNALAQVPITPSGGQFVIDPLDVRRGPFDLGPGFPFHQWLQSPYHRESLLCATCHDVSNPTLSKQPDGSYQLNALNAPHPTQNEYEEFPVERTFSEWKASAYAKAEINTVDAQYPGGRFGGAEHRVSTCQDCHMPKTTGTACQPVFGAPIRPDLPLHDFNGVNSWVLDAVRSLYPDSETGLSTQSVAAAHARNDAMQARASDLRVWVRNNQLAVRIVNQTGHKLPSGYSEGRRMWIEVKYFDALNQPISTIGGYDAATATLSTAGAKIYEMRLGIDAQQSAATGVPAGESFHFVLNNTILSDNRIPPRGFTNPGFDAVQAKPVGATYAEEQYWDDTLFPIPPNAASAVVKTWHQTTTREYIEFLRDNNTTNNTGQIAYNQWVQHGKSAPVQMQSASITIATPGFVEPIVYGLAKTLSNGRTPTVWWAGEPRLSTNNFKVQVRNALPRSLGVLRSSPTTQSVPFKGGTLLLGGVTGVAASFQLDAMGQALVPIPVLPGMVGTAMNYQAFFRDVNAPEHYGITNAIHVEFCY
jgi:hypothetical protein